MYVPSALTVCARLPPHVVHEDDGALVVLRRGPLDDLRDARLLPVVAVGVDEDAGVAEAADLLVDGPAVVVDGVDLGGVRGTEQRRLDPRGAREGQLRLHQFALEPCRALVGEVDVREGVDADLVALVHEVLHHARGAADHRAHHEERGLDVVLLEHLEDLGGPGRVGTVVEGEHDGLVRHGLCLGRAVVERQDGAAVKDLLRDLVVGRAIAHALVVADLGAQVAVEEHHAGERQQKQQREDHARLLQRRGPAGGPPHLGGGAPADRARTS